MTLQFVFTGDQPAVFGHPKSKFGIAGGSMFTSWNRLLPAAFVTAETGKVETKKTEKRYVWLTATIKPIEP